MMIGNQEDDADGVEKLTFGRLVYKSMVIDGADKEH